MCEEVNPLLTVVRMMQDKIVARSPSLFIDGALFSEFAHDTEAILSESFFNTGRVMDIQLVMGLHPGYLEAHQRCASCL